MGDGSKHNTGLHLSIYGFTNNEAKLLQSTLIHKFGFVVSIHQHKSVPRLYIFKQSIKKLREIVLPYIVESLKYKLGV